MAADPDPSADPGPDDRQRRLGLVLAECQDALDRGRPLTAAEAAARWPEFAAEVAAFLDDHARLARATAPLRDAVRLLAAPPLLPFVLGDFRLLREIGRGGMGLVYEAEQVSLGRRVALKVLSFAATLDPRQRQRFANEARAAAGLHHEHIVPVYAVGTQDGVPYFAMQMIDGQTLAEVLDGLRVGRKLPPADDAPTAPLAPPHSAPSPSPATPPPPAPIRPAGLSADGTSDSPAYFRHVADLGAQAADALEHAHGLGIVHRDIKPGNLLVDDRGHLWVTDFGLAHVASEHSLTLTGDMLGTLRYMAPEQAQARHGLVDHRADVYGLGATLYEMLTLTPAVPGDSRAAILRQLTEGELVPPRRLAPRVPVDLETIVLKALAREPAERYASAAEMADDLRRWLADLPIRARRPTLGQRLAGWLRRHRGLTRTAVALLALLAAVLTVTVYLVWREKDRAVQAEGRTEEALRRAEGALLSEAHLRQQADLAVSEVTATRDPEFLNPRDPSQVKGFLFLCLDGLREDDSGAVRAALASSCVNAANRLKDNGKPTFDRVRFQAAEELYRRAVAEYRVVVARLPDNDLYCWELARSLKYLGSLLYHYTGKPAEAPPLGREACRILEELVARSPTASHRSELGSARMELAIWGVDPAEAEALLRGALELQRQFFREDGAWARAQARRLFAHERLVNLLRGQGRLAECEALGRDALATWTEVARAWPDEWVARDGLAVCHEVLADFYRDTGRPGEAVAPGEAGVALRRGLARQGVAGLDTATPYCDRALIHADVLLRLGRPAEAEIVCREVLEFLHSPATPGAGPMRHYALAATARRALALSALGRPAEAEAATRAALGSDQSDLHLVPAWQQATHNGPTGGASRAGAAGALAAPGAGPGLLAPSRASARDCLVLATHFARAGQLPWADDVTARALALFSAELDSDADLPAALRALAEAYQAGGHYERAAVLMAAHIAVEHHRRAADAPELANAVVGLGWVLLLLDRPAEAEPLLREGLAIREKHPPDDSRIAGTRVLLGSALAALGRCAEAEPLLRTGHDGLLPKRAILGTHAFRLPLAAFRLAQLCEATGRPDEARRWRDALAHDYGLEHLPPPSEVLP